MEVLSYIDEKYNWHDLPTYSVETEQRKKIDIGTGRKKWNIAHFQLSIKKQTNEKET